jgi:hypothetical protein
MSIVEPLGTWQYAHAVCWPRGARESSNSDGCTSSTYGRSGVRPLHTSRSEYAISSSVPPRCTVPARAHGAARHGIGSSRAQSTLNAAIP